MDIFSRYSFSPSSRQLGSPVYFGILTIKMSEQPIKIENEFVCKIKNADEKTAIEDIKRIAKIWLVKQRLGGNSDDAKADKKKHL